MNSGNLIYKYHFSKVTWLEGVVKPTLWKQKESVNSFSFCGEGNKCEVLRNHSISAVFPISCKLPTFA